jgi:type II secretory pathway pseudopilin PulG
MRRRGREDGISLIELVMALSFLLIVLVSVGLALHSGVQTTRELDEMNLVHAQAQTYVDRVIRQNFGAIYEADPTAEQVDQFFDPDSTPGTVTVNQLTRWPKGDGGWKFTLADFPVTGDWLVTVTADLDGDGSTTSSDLEKSNSVYSILVYFSGELVLQGCRAKEPTL